MPSHYSKEELEFYRNHQMSVLGQIACSAHLKECPACAKLLEELNDDDRLLRDLRVSVQRYESVTGSEPRTSK